MPEKLENQFQELQITIEWTDKGATIESKNRVKCPVCTRRVTGSHQCGEFATQTPKPIEPKRTTTNG